MTNKPNESGQGQKVTGEVERDPVKEAAEWARLCATPTTNFSRYTPLSALPPKLMPDAPTREDGDKTEVLAETSGTPPKPVQDVDFEKLVQAMHDVAKDYTPRVSDYLIRKMLDRVIHTQRTAAREQMKEAPLNKPEKVDFDWVTGKHTTQREDR